MLVVLVAKGRNFIFSGLFSSFFSLIADNERVRWSLAGTQRAVKHRERLEALECISLLHLTIVNGVGGWRGVNIFNY